MLTLKNLVSNEFEGYACESFIPRFPDVENARQKKQASYRRADIHVEAVVRAFGPLNDWPKTLETGVYTLEVDFRQD